MRLLLASLLLMQVTACAAPGRLRVVIGPGSIQENLAESFPLAGDLGFARLELTDPELLLEEGADRVGLRLHVRVTMAIVVMEGTVAVEGELRYQAEEATFYVDRPRVLELEMPGIPVEQVPEILTTINDLLATMLPKVPVYRLEEGTTRMLLRSIKVENGALVTELGI